ncbi:hypothetical protein E2C01_079493 [Portunus trituberculatus]|uniref:Uncharacterized protein n=1 Tax=Portunus trituberculatus TaxID=210409 RepID=A0A5B7IX10_PORTR|nr:hypothetical protein [Portunus trituberculatus]
MEMSGENKRGEREENIKGTQEDGRRKGERNMKKLEHTEINLESIRSMEKDGRSLKAREKEDNT